MKMTEGFAPSVFSSPIPRNGRLAYTYRNDDLTENDMSDIYTELREMEAVAADISREHEEKMRDIRGRQEKVLHRIGDAIREIAEGKDI